MMQPENGVPLLLTNDMIESHPVPNPNKIMFSQSSRLGIEC